MKLYLKDIPDDVLQELNARAQKAGRSINDQVIQVLRVALERPAMALLMTHRGHSLWHRMRQKT